MRIRITKLPKNIKAIGGVLQSHGSDWGDGLMVIGAGGSHEENKYDGVQLGVDNENVPNLVEEGETVYENYVFSNRILADEATKQKFHLPKKKDITFAEISKKLEKESSERPNDPISEAGLKAMLSTLADEQERQKQEMEAERAKAAFEALSPEEQTAIMQRAAQEEQVAQQAAQQQAMAEQAAQENAQISPEQAAMLQQQAMQADGSQAAIGQQPVIAACGGRINKFEKGGLKKKLYTMLGRATDSDFLSWLKDMGEKGIDSEAIMAALDKDDLEALRKNDAFIKALGKEDRGLAHSIASLRNNLGLVTPEETGSFFTDPDKGNWDNQLYEGWKDSQDDAWLELVKKYGDELKEKAKDKEWLEKAFKDTDAYKKTTEWLKKDPENMRKYLNSVLETSTSSSAKNHALQFVNEDGTWKDPSKVPTYAQVFGENGKGVRETHPGTYWHSVREANRGSQSLNYLLNDDGSVELIPGTTEGLIAAGTHSWQGDKDDMTVNYFTRPMKVASNTAAPAGGTEAVVDENGTLVPVKNPTWMRYAGLFGPAVGLGMQLAGVGKPDTSGIDAAIASANSPVHTADWMPIGNYLTYRPFDRLFHSNELLGTSRGTERALLNTNSPSRNAGLLANSYNTMVALGKLAREGEEYNDALEKQVEEFNRGTNMFNAQAYNQNQQFNASERNRARQYDAQIALQGAAQKMDADAGWNNSLYGNVAGLFKGIGDIGNENMAMNWRNALATSGAMGIMDEDLLEQARMAKRVRKAANGGKLKKKKKGLTI